MNRRLLLAGALSAALAPLRRLGPAPVPADWGDLDGLSATAYAPAPLYTITSTGGQRGRTITVGVPTEEAVYAAFAQLRSYDTVVIPAHFPPIPIRVLATVRNVNHVTIQLGAPLVLAQDAFVIRRPTRWVLRG